MMFKKLPLAVLTSTLVVSTSSHALDIGLEASARVEASDNVGADVDGLEEDGQIGYVLLGVYGEQRGRLFQAGFSGELEARRVLSDDDGDPTTLNDFFGAATLLLSPSFDWYFGNVLGTVQTSDELLSFEDEDTRRRNVFVTGPSFNYDINSSSSVLAEVLYLNQSQDDIDLAQLVTARFNWRQDTRRGNTFGIDLSDIYTDEPESEDGADFNSDTNRFSASVFWERNRGLLTWYAAVGGTRFQTEEDAVNGANAELRVARRLGPQTDLTFSLGTDLTDDNILTIDSLLDDGAGIVPEATGIFRSNNASLVYSTSSVLNSFEIGVRGSATEFQALDDNIGFDDRSLDDNFTLSTFAVLSRALAPRWSLDVGAELENQRFSNVDDDIDSIRANLLLSYQISESFSISGGVRSTHSEGINTRDNISQAADGSFEITENRALVQLAWAPPSRATQEQVVQLKQLLR